MCGSWCPDTGNGGWGWGKGEVWAASFEPLFLVALGPVTSKFKLGLPGQHEGVSVKVGGWNIFYSAVYWHDLELLKFSPLSVDLSLLSGDQEWEDGVVHATSFFSFCPIHPKRLLLLTKHALWFASVRRLGSCGRTASPICTALANSEKASKQSLSWFR